jgi:hypothetical protein
MWFQMQMFMRHIQLHLLQNLSQRRMSFIHNSVYTFFDSSYVLVATGNEHSEGFVFDTAIQILNWPQMQAVHGTGVVIWTTFKCARLSIIWVVWRWKWYFVQSDNICFTKRTNQFWSEHILKHMCIIYQSLRGHNVMETLSHDFEYMDVIHEQQNVFKGGPYFGKSQHFNRSFEQGISGGLWTKQLNTICPLATLLGHKN